MKTNRIPIVFNLLISLILLITIVSCETPQGEFEKAKEINTIVAYNSFIKKFPQDTLVYEARKQLARLEYLNFAKKPSLGELLKYKDKYPNSNYLDSVKNIQLAAKNYNGIEIRVESVDYNGKNELLDLFPGKLHFGKKPNMYIRDGSVTGIEAGKMAGTLKILDSELSQGYPALIVTFCNKLDSTKEFSIENLSDLMIRTNSEKNIFPIGISAIDNSDLSLRRLQRFTGLIHINDIDNSYPSFSFPPAELKNWELKYQIPVKDSLQIGFLFPEAKKGDLIIFDSCFVTTIK
jgi:hypothetical protein